MRRNIESLDRIINKYFMNKNRDPIEEKEVIEFLFRYLKKEGRNGSILFRHIKNSPERYNIIIRLYNKYRYKFDFDIVNSSLFLTAFDLIKINQKMKQILYFFACIIPLLIIISFSLYFKTKQMKTDFIEKLTTQEKQIKDNKILENEIEILKLKHKNENKESKEKVLKTLAESYEKEMKTYKENEAIKQNHKNEMIELKQNCEMELQTLKESYESEILKLKQKHENELKTYKAKSTNESQILKESYENEILELKQKQEKEKEQQDFIDSFDFSKVSAKIFQQRIQGQNEITIFAFGKKRVFKLDNNGNVIIRLNAILKKTTQVRRRRVFQEEKFTEYPAEVIYNFSKGKIYPQVKEISTHLHHFGIFSNTITRRKKWELIIELFDGFVFKETKKPIYTLKSPNIDFCIPEKKSIDIHQSVNVPKKLQISMI